MIPALFFTLAASFLLLRARSSSGEVAAGAAMALALLLHQLCVLPAAALIVVLALQRRRPAGRAATPFALACVLPTLAFYVVVGLAAAGCVRPRTSSTGRSPRGGEASSGPNPPPPGSVKAPAPWRRAWSRWPPSVARRFPAGDR